MKDNVELICDYVDLCNKYGWYSPRCFWFTIVNFRNKELQKLMSKARYIRYLFRNGELPVVSEKDIKKIQESS